MLGLVLTVTNPPGLQTCLLGFICANETFISIYGVVFTIVISLGVYIYGLQDKREKVTLLDKTNVKTIIKNGLLFFAITFLGLPSPFYELLNFVLFGSLLLEIWAAFKEVIKFNTSELSAANTVKKFIKGVIKKKLEDFEYLKVKNDLLQKKIEDEKIISADGKSEIKRVERFIFEENDNSYNFITAQKSGYITELNLKFLFSDEISQENNKEFSQKDLFYIPYNISVGAPVDFDTIILGVKKTKENTKLSDEKIARLGSYIVISEEFENPWSYFEAEVRSYYSDIFSLIKTENAKELELKLEEFSGFVNLLTSKPESYSDIIQFVNDNFIFPIQKQAFKQADVDCIRKVAGFSLGFLYQALSKNSIQVFNIFLRNLGNAFYESFSLDSLKKKEFYDAYFRWLKEVARYSIKPKIEKDKNYVEYAVNFLSSLNGQLKIAFDNKNLEVFSRVLGFLNDSFARERNEHEEATLLDEVILIKKAVIFGFTAWAYKYRSGEDFYKQALFKLLTAVEKDPVYYHGNVGDNLNYYLSVYLKAIEISEKRGSFGWDSWGMPEGEVYTVTIHDDMKNLLVDRLLKLVVENPALPINIKTGNYNDMLSLIKEGNQQFDPFINKTQHSFMPTSGITDEQFVSVKSKFYEIFAQITQKYETDVRTKLIEQPIDDIKFNEFVQENFSSYEKSRVLYRIQNFIKESIKRADGFGYNILLHKEQFVAVTNVHYTNEDQFGENLARSEDNKILESIYKTFDKIPTLKKDKIGKVISAESEAKAIVLWITGYFNIQDTNPESFKPHWQEANSRQDNGLYYQGSINGIPVYIIYKFQEHKYYPDTLFIFKDEAFLVSEFEIEKDDTLDSANTKFAESANDCISLSITNLSTLEENRTKIVEKWISDDPASVPNKEGKIEELKTSVVFKFFKGLSTDNLTISDSKIKIFHIN